MSAALYVAFGFFLGLSLRFAWAYADGWSDGFTDGLRAYTGEQHTDSDCRNGGAA